MEIECLQELGTEGLLDDDCYLAECMLGDLEDDTSGMGDSAIQAAREASRLERMDNGCIVTFRYIIG
jgi:hypothetical protein